MRSLGRWIVCWEQRLQVLHTERYERRPQGQLIGANSTEARRCADYLVLALEADEMGRQRIVMNPARTRGGMPTPPDQQHAGASARASFHWLAAHPALWGTLRWRMTPWVLRRDELSGRGRGLGQISERGHSTCARRRRAAMLAQRPAPRMPLRASTRSYRFRCSLGDHDARPSLKSGPLHTAHRIAVPMLRPTRQNPLEGELAPRPLI